MNFKKILTFVVAFVLSAAAAASPQFLYIKKADNSIVQLKDTDGNPVTTILNHFQGGVYYVASYGAKCDGTIDDTAAINSTITAAAVTGGDVVFPAQTCYVAGNITPAANVRLKGAGWTASLVSWPAPTGTVLKGAGTNDGIVWNRNCYGFPACAQPGTAALAAAAALTSFRVEDIAFQNFKRAITLGAQYNTGVYFGKFKNLYFHNNTDWDIYCENCQEDFFEDITAYNGVTSTGGIFFGQSQTAENNGNARFNHIYIQNESYGQRGIVFQATTGHLNDIIGSDLQTNQSGSSKVSQAATMANGSATITVTDATKYPIDMPVTVSATANGFTKYQTYFVVAQNVGANTVQIANYQGDTAHPIAATGSTAVNLDSYGMPGIEFVGYGPVSSGNSIQSGHMTGLDMEGYATTYVLDQNSLLALGIGEVFNGSTMQGTFYASSLVGRNALGSYTTNVSITLDADQSYNPFFMLGGDLATDTDTAVIQAQPIGFFRDRALGVQALNIAANPPSGIHNTFQGQQAANRMFIYPSVPLGQRVSSTASTSLTLGALNAGTLIYSGSGAATWTLPTLQAGVGGAAVGNTAGLGFEIVNNASAAVAITLNTGGTDKFGFSGSAKTSYSIPQGGSLTIRAAYDGTNVFWAVLAINGAT